MTSFGPTLQRIGGLEPRRTRRTRHGGAVMSTGPSHCIALMSILNLVGRYEAVKMFLDRNHLKLMIRAHEAQAHGYVYTPDSTPKWEARG